MWVRMVSLKKILSRLDCTEEKGEEGKEFWCKRWRCLRLIEGDRLIILNGIKNGVERHVEVSWFRVGRGLIQLKPSCLKFVRRSE